MVKKRLLILMLALVALAGYSAQNSFAEPPIEDSIQSVPQFATAVPSGNALLACTLTSADTSEFLGCHLSYARDYLPAFEKTAVSNQDCNNGEAGEYPCDSIHLQSLMPLADMGGGNGNDIWGWTDPTTNKEYVIMGRTNGTSFVDISDPINPIYLGNLPTSSISSIWRDMKVYQDHAYIVADSAGNHGMQVFDLTQLRSVTSPPVTFSAIVLYTDLGSSHNIFINEDSGTAYALGNSSGLNTCGGGLHIIDIQTPTSPAFLGCYNSDGYIHDTQCVNYTGPDADHSGKEICFNASVNDLTIVDLTDKSNPIRISGSGYPTNVYAHQGWLTDDQRYLFLNDEGDETAQNQFARTYIFDVSDLDAPRFVKAYTAVEPAIDHNLYIHNGLIFEANYRSGLRVLEFDESSETLSEVAFFDTFETSETNEAQFNGAWSSYPFFPSGNIAVSTIEHGLFILRLDDSVGDGSGTPDFDSSTYLPLMVSPEE
ncbi:MAG: choice-of-anchor B family protein [Chloroflexota bacterium]